MATQLKQQFMYGYMDGDIMHVLETEVPPGQLAAVSAFRPDVSSGLGALNCYWLSPSLLPFIREALCLSDPEGTAE